MEKTNKEIYSKDYAKSVTLNSMKTYMMIG